MRLVADLESDNFLDKLTKIHCIAVMDADNASRTWVFGPGQIDDGVQLLQSADELIFHNGISLTSQQSKNCIPGSALVT